MAKVARNGSEVARFGTVDGKNDTVWQGCRHIHANKHVVANGCGWRFWPRDALAQSAGDARWHALMELIYHRWRWLSRAATWVCRDRSERSGCRIPLFARPHAVFWRGAGGEATSEA